MALLPLLTNLAIPLGIKFVNSLLTAPKSGAEKKSLLMQILDAVIGKVKALNLTAEEHPGADVLSGLIEGVFAPMKASGAENAAPTTAEAWLLQGSAIKFTKIS